MRRVGVDAHVLTGKFQGSRTYLLNILRHLGRIDAGNHYLIYSFDPEATRALLPYANFEHVRLAMRPSVPRLLLYWPWEQSRRRLDMLVTQHIAPLAYPRRQLVVVHDLLFESHPHYFGWLAGLRFRCMVRLSARRARAVVTVSETTRAELLARYGVGPARVHLARGGIDPDAHHVDMNRPAPAKRPYVLAVGRLEPRKNIGTLLRAFRLMRTPGVHLVMIGKEDFCTGTVPAELHALHAAGRATWLTAVGDADLPYYYRHAGVFAFPTFAEGFGLPVLEALVQGIPVVTSSHPALREAGGDLARYFDAEAPDADQRLADLLDRSIAEGPHWTEATRAAHLAAFDWRCSAAALLSAINQA